MKFIPSTYIDTSTHGTIDENVVEWISVEYIDVFDKQLQHQGVASRRDIHEQAYGIRRFIVGSQRC